MILFVIFISYFSCFVYRFQAFLQFFTLPSSRLMIQNANSPGSRGFFSRPGGLGVYLTSDPRTQ